RREGWQPGPAGAGRIVQPGARPGGRAVAAAPGRNLPTGWLDCPPMPGSAGNVHLYQEGYTAGAAPALHKPGAVRGLRRADGCGGLGHIFGRGADGAAAPGAAAPPGAVPLGVVWMLGFVLLTASMALVSAALAGVVRSLEPLASVLLGLATGERCSLKVLGTLALVCGGAVVASKGGGSLHAGGVALAVLSNFAFCSRPLLAKRLRAGLAAGELDDTSIFFNVTLIGTCGLVVATLPLEGAALMSSLELLRQSGQVSQFYLDMLLNSLSFFLYQYAQLRVMSQMAPLSFSVLTPVSKALLILVCAVYFGDPFGASNAAGLAMLTSGVFAFTAARRADAQALAEKSAEKER
ncbi:unnamed protein product, partial [Prorocentrum cordatum]